MAMTRLISAAHAAGCALAPSIEDLDGPNNVMPRRHAPTQSDAAEFAPDRTAVTVWQKPAARPHRFRDFVGSLWYGGATPA